MTEQLILFDTAVTAKEKGFDLECRHCYPITDTKTGDHFLLDGFETDELGNFEGEQNWNVSGVRPSAPTQSLLQKWLRENHGFHIVVAPSILKGINNVRSKTYSTQLKSYLNTTIHNIRTAMDFTYNTYEEALEAGLQAALKLIKL